MGPLPAVWSARSAECAVFGCRGELKGEVPFGLVVPKSGMETSATDVATQIVATMRDRIGPVTAFKRIIVVDRLSKTRSGKILRSTIKRIADGEPYTPPGTIEDTAVLREIEGAIHSARER